MGLEKIVDMLLKPLEGVAQLVYDAVYLEKEEIVKGSDGKESIKKVYSSKPSELKHYLDLLRVDYKTSKDMVYEMSVRPIDKFLKNVYEKFKKGNYTKPLVDGYNAHPILATVAGLLALCYLI
jgi:hypothetical protein